MNTNYSPYAAALAAAATELTSARAHRFYVIRAQQDTQAAICAVVTVGCWVYQIAALAFQLGSAARQYFSAVDAPACIATSQQPVQRRSPLVLMPAAAPIALLPAYIEPRVIAQPPKPSPLPAPTVSALPKLPSHSLSKTELIIQINQRSPRKVQGIWKMRRDALEAIYAGV
jgi:hypothetical protein